MEWNVPGGDATTSGDSRAYGSLLARERARGVGAKESDAVHWNTASLCVKTELDKRPRCSTRSSSGFSSPHPNIAGGRSVTSTPSM